MLLKLGAFADALPATTPEESFDPETFDGNIGANWPKSMEQVP